MESFEKKEYDDWTLQQFKAWVTNWHQLQGIVTIYQDDKQLTSLNSSVGDVFKRNKNPICVRFDTKFAVAAGGYAEPSEAHSKRGHAAVARGGRANGGRADAKTGLRGGDATSGDAIGESGVAGVGLGGAAFAPNGGTARGGRTAAGSFIKSPNC